MPKCVKCDNTKFKIEKLENNQFCYIICTECDTAVGVLEDIDFKKHNNKVINNHGMLHRKVVELEEKIESINKTNKEIYNILELINNKIRRA